MSHGLTTDAPFTREQLLARRDRPAHVVGAASAEGVAVTRLLRDLGFDVVLHDLRAREELRRAFRTTHGAYSLAEQDALWQSLRPLLDAGRFGDDYLTGIDAGALVSLGQGWYLDEHNRARVVDAVPADALVVSMSALYFALSRAPIAGITGTNGKSTTVALTDALLIAGGVTHRTCGNERSTVQALPDVEQLTPDEWLLLEISNRQLLQLSHSPVVAAITALTPDHLEEHGGMDGYVAAKRRMFAHQGADGIAIVNGHDERAYEVARAGGGTLVACGVGAHDGPGVRWVDGQLIATDVPVWGGQPLTGSTVIAAADDLTLPGAHNQVNAAVAVATALACGAAPSTLAAGLRSFEGKSLRLERLADIGGVELWSDIKSTTPEATLAALDALADRRVLLIAGGDDKGLAYDGLAEAIAARQVHALLVPGSATDKLAAACARVPGAAELLAPVTTLALALDRALEVARPGDAVVVSPAAAGFWTTQLQGKPSLRALARERRSRQDAADANASASRS